MKIGFITGITGQDGSYLAELLLEKGYKVYGFVRRTSLMYPNMRIEHLKKDIDLRFGDMTDSFGLMRYIKFMIENNPDFEVLEIYNLAAQSHVAVSFEIPEYTTDVDAIGVLKLLEIIRAMDKDIRDRIRFYQAGTSELYGKVLEIPQDEKTPFNPVSPYAVAKLYGFYMTKVYREAYNLYAVNGILFNHESSRRGENFVTKKIVDGVKDIVNGNKEFIELGNLDSKRDWGHAKDYVYGMWLMLQKEKPDDYVLATGRSQSVRQFVEDAFRFKGLEIHWEGSGINEIGIDQNDNVRVRINERYYRPCEVDILIGKPDKAISELKWKPKYDTTEKLLEEMFNE